ncbi:MAG: hypothetical protein JWP27_2725 [Flaviaesturariibacter sp.]|nr:hypothetical protein [Flaviaesturariibacter sp.]
MTLFAWIPLGGPMCGLAVVADLVVCRELQQRHDLLIHPGSRTPGCLTEREALSEFLCKSVKFAAEPVNFYHNRLLAPFSPTFAHRQKRRYLSQLLNLKFRLYG